MMSRWPFHLPLVACLVLYLPRDGGAQGNEQRSQDAMAESGIAMTNMDFGNSALKQAQGRNLQTTSRVNQNFLRRGTRADLERIAIERLMGRRGPDDWLLAGSDAWLERRQKLDREAAELRERIAIADACARDPGLEECKSPARCLRHPVLVWSLDSPPRSLWWSPRTSVRHEHNRRDGGPWLRHFLRAAVSVYGLQ